MDLADCKMMPESPLLQQRQSHKFTGQFCGTACPSSSMLARKVTKPCDRPEETVNGYGAHAQQFFHLLPPLCEDVPPLNNDSRTRMPIVNVRKQLAVQSASTNNPRPYRHNTKRRA